jgi:hypothetical protein
MDGRRMSTQSPKGAPTSAVVTSMMARIVMFIVFLGSGLSLALALAGSPYAGQVCLGSGFIAAVALMIGAYFVAKAKT